VAYSQLRKQRTLASDALTSTRSTTELEEWELVTVT
jgi:hypothetical protein